MVFIPLIVVLFIHGAAWASDKLLPILNGIGIVTLGILIVIVLPLSFIKKCRAWCGILFVYWSYLCGLCLWMASLLLTINLWGYFAAIIGIFMAGIGVLPIAIIACVFKCEWSFLVQLILQILFVIMARFYGFFLVGKSDMEAERDRFGALDNLREAR